MRLALFLTTVLLVLSAAPVVAQFQEDGERATQAGLPQSKSPIWTTLRTTKIGVNEARGIFTAVHPPAVKALAGKNLSLSGFLMALETDKAMHHFLLSKYTPVCSFCPPGEPNEVVEVSSAQPVAYVERMVTVTGKFALQNNGEKGLFFQMAATAVR